VLFSWAALLGAGGPFICDAARAAQPAGTEFPTACRRVDRGALLAAMQREKAKGYNLLVSTTAGRFTAAILLDLVGRARSQDSPDSVLLVHYDDWYEAYRQCLQLDSSAVPEFVALQKTYHQSQYVEWGFDSTRITVKKGPTPLEVLRVHAGWPDSGAASEEYTFVDTAASPDVRVTNERVISYWLANYGNVIVRDRIRGIRGQPLEGALALAFKVVGSGRAEWSRSMATADGLILEYARVSKGPFSVKLTTTTLPNGHLLKGLPDGREDLKPLEDRLKEPVELGYPRDASE
jgi:hypothetical protein